MLLYVHENCVSLFKESLDGTCNIIMLTMVQKAIRTTQLVEEKQLHFIFRCCMESLGSFPAVHFILTFQHSKWLCLHYWANKH